MSIRTWIVAVAFGLIAASVQAQDQTKSTKSGAEAQQEVPDQLPFGIPIRIIEDDEATEARERREREGEQREKDDLIAQQGMNRATQAMNEATQSMKWAAWLSFGAVAIGTALLVWTLFLTRQANKAARDAVNVTREIGVAQTAGYIQIQRKLGWITDGGYPNVPVMIENPGNTPIRNVHVIFRIYAPDDVASSPSEDGMIFSEVIPVGAISSGAEKPVSFVPSMFKEAPKWPIYQGVVGAFAVDVFKGGVFEWLPITVFASRDKLDAMERKHKSALTIMDDGEAIDVSDLIDRGWPADVCPTGKPKTINRENH